VPEKLLNLKHAVQVIPSFFNPILVPSSICFNKEEVLFIVGSREIVDPEIQYEVTVILSF
jgi:hypothetical protein